MGDGILEQVLCDRERRERSLAASLADVLDRLETVRKRLGACRAACSSLSSGATVAQCAYDDATVRTVGAATHVQEAALLADLNALREEHAAVRASRLALERLIERRRVRLRAERLRTEARELDEANLARWASLVQEGREAPP
jgi:hypothetical protein